MTDQSIDPAATPEDDATPEIAADDAGASAIAERAHRTQDAGPDAARGGNASGIDDHQAQTGMEGEGV